MSYDLAKIKTEFNNICAKAGVNASVDIRINGRLTRTLGRVCFNKSATGYCTPTVVEFSRDMLETTTDDTIYSVIQHEAAHYIIFQRSHEDHGHDATFKKVCEEIGCSNNKASTKVEKTVAVEESYKYEIKCPTCNKIIGKYHRRGKIINSLDRCYCNICGNGGLTLITNW